MSGPSSSWSRAMSREVPVADEEVPGVAKGPADRLHVAAAGQRPHGLGEEDRGAAFRHRLDLEQEMAEGQLGLAAAEQVAAATRQRQVGRGGIGPRRSAEPMPGGRGPEDQGPDRRRGLPRRREGDRRRDAIDAHGAQPIAIARVAAGRRQPDTRPPVGDQLRGAAGDRRVAQVLAGVQVDQPHLGGRLACAAASCACSVPAVLDWFLMLQGPGCCSENKQSAALGWPPDRRGRARLRARILHGGRGLSGEDREDCGDGDRPTA